MVNSVNANLGATIALQSLNRTNKQLDVVQKQVSTGYRVSDAFDDGAAFAVAQGLRATVKGNEAVGERLSAAKGLLSVTQSALQGVSDTVGDIKKVLVKLADASLSTSERTQYNADYTALRGDITKYLQGANFGTANLIKASAASVSVISDANGGTVSLTATDLEATLATLAGTASATAANVQAILVAGTGALDVFQATVNTAIANVGANNRTVSNQQNFISVLGDAVEEGIGAIADADLAKASAKLQSLQIRQQLGTQALSIANQSPSILLSLFK